MLQFILFMMNLNLKNPDHMFPVPLPESVKSVKPSEPKHLCLESGTVLHCDGQCYVRKLVEQRHLN